MQFSDLYGTQLDIELASADRTQLFTTARRKKAVNDGLHVFERTTYCTPVYGTIPIVSGIGEYDLLATFPNYISFHEQAEPAVKIDNGSGSIRWIQGDDLPKREPQWLDSDAPGWRADPPSTPTSWYLRDDAGTTYLGLDPAPLVPSGYTYSILVPYCALSTDMAADADLPFTVNGKAFARLAPYHQAPVHYAAALLEPLRKGYPAADRQMKLFAGYIAQYLTKKSSDGTGQVTFARNYLRDSRRGATRPVDPHRFP